MLLRLVNMRGVDLNVFDFDFDLTWAAFFLSADGRIYGRFGGRDAESPDKYLTLAGLKYAMRQALATHEKAPRDRPAGGDKPAVTAEHYAAAKRMKAEACIHCHQVYDFRRDELRAARKWSLDDVWKMLPPLPDNVGLTLDPEQGNRVKVVGKDSPAARARLRPGDVLQTVNGQPVASFADVQYALHRAPAPGPIPVAWQRDGKAMTGEMTVADGWRKSDLSWRAFMWGVEPVASVYGRDLSAAEKKALGLSEKALAFRQGDFVPPAAREAGIRKDDIILGIDGKQLDLTMLQFNAYVRLNYKVGDRITFNVLRDGKRLDVPMKLPGRAF